MSSYTIKGSFMLEGKKHYYLSQSQLADGWKMVLPPSNKVETLESAKRFKELEEGEVCKREFVNKILYNEVNLAQLPLHLVKKYKPSKEVYFDSFYKFKVVSTPHDEIILKLVSMFDIRYPRPEQKQEMADIAEFLESNDITGWVTIRGKKMSI